MKCYVCRMIFDSLTEPHCLDVPQKVASMRPTIVRDGATMHASKQAASTHKPAKCHRTHHPEEPSKSNDTDRAQVYHYHILLPHMSLTGTDLQSAKEAASNKAQENIRMHHRNAPPECTHAQLTLYMYAICMCLHKVVLCIIMS